MDRISIFAVGLWAVVCGCGGCEKQPKLAATAAEIKVDLKVDFQGQAENIETRQSVKSGLSVFDLLVHCKSVGELDFKHRGSGETAFVSRINDVENQMAGGLNWLFYVNGQMADRGAGVVRLNDGDVVQWKFSAEYLE